MPRLTPSANAGMRFDTENGAVRSFFNPGLNTVLAGGSVSNEAVTGEFLALNFDLFHLGGIGLVLTGERDGSSQTTCRYEQFQNNIPVYGAYLNVTIRIADQQVMSSVNKIDYTIPPEVGTVAPKISSENALRLMHEKYDPVCRRLTHSEPKLSIYLHLLVWRIEVDLEGPKGYWELMVDAMTGSIVAESDRRRFYHTRPAKVFWPDPVTSSRNTDLHWKSPRKVLDKELVDVILENLEDPVDSKYYLRGRWVRIAELEQPEVPVPVSETGFIYSGTDRKLLSVMAYYYTDRLVEWLRSLNVRAFNSAMCEAIEVDAQALDSEDNSHFVAPIAGPVYIGFGEGGTPDASDPGVIVHEFGHALHYFLLGRLLIPGSCEEGFNDFLSCVFRDRYNVHGFDRANPFPWDNNATIGWDKTRRCDMDYRFDDPAYKKFGLYKKGTVYASALWDIYLKMGGNSENAGDRLKAAGEITVLCLDSLLAVGDAGPVLDLVDGLISSDKCRTGGRFEEVIRGVFRERGLF